MKMITLEQILNHTNDGTELMLKMDCEGCEYESLITEKEHVLNRFTRMVIEYHHGPDLLRRKLETCGFYVKHTSSTRVYNPKSRSVLMVGFIMAERKDKSLKR